MSIDLPPRITVAQALALPAGAARAAARRRRRAQPRPADPLGPRGRGLLHRLGAARRRAAADDRHGDRQESGRPAPLRAGARRGRRRGAVRRARAARSTTSPALVREAEPRGLPLVAFRRDVRFIPVTEAIHTELVNGRYAVRQRCDEIHGQP